MDAEIFVETERLQIRRFDDADAAALAAYRSDPGVARYQSWTDFSAADARAFIAGLRTDEPGRPGVWYQFAVAQRGRPELIGDLGLRRRDDLPDTADLGYTLSAAAQGHGYGGEMVTGLIRWAFARWPDLARIVATVDERNLRSLALARRVGMIEVEVVETVWHGEACVERVFEVRRAPLASREEAGQLGEPRDQCGEG